MSTPWHVVQHAESTSVLINATPAMTASYSTVSQAPPPLHSALLGKALKIKAFAAQSMEPLEFFLVVSV